MTFWAIWCILFAVTGAYTPIVVNNVTNLGRQLSPDVTNVSRDGGVSALINGHIVWIYDDTECFASGGAQLSFVSNTAAYADQSAKNVVAVNDFGVQMVGKDKTGQKQYAILADKTVGTGGWIPFVSDELAYNNERKGKERVAIWPGSSPTSISTSHAFFFAPLVYVDSKPKDPTKQYQARGLTLITITAPSSGPVAVRQGDLVVPGTQIAFGGFAALLGYTPASSNIDGQSSDGRDVYLFGVTNAGLQLARVGVNDMSKYENFRFFDPSIGNFTSEPPKLDLTDVRRVYLPGSYMTGSIFFSPYFSTFIFVYFNRMADSTFYIRYLDLDKPLWNDKVWVKGGRAGRDFIEHEDVEALVKYSWSAEQILYKSPPDKGGFNYAGNAHPEYFNRQYFAASLYPDGTPNGQRLNAWYGSSIMPEKNAKGDGRNLLLSWTSQVVSGANNNGIFQVHLAMVEFRGIPLPPGQNPTSTSASTVATRVSASATQTPPDLNMIPKGSGGNGLIAGIMKKDWGPLLLWTLFCVYIVSAFVSPNGWIRNL